MSRATSIHIGVNRPQGPYGGRPLHYSEASAWRMAELASQAGCGSLLVLRGEAATRQAVHDALAGAAASLGPGDVLLVSFSGHGCRVADADRDEGFGWDEAWCLHDGVLLDDKLAGYWRLFDPGVRVVVVAECCHGGGSGRDGELPAPVVGAADAPPVMRGGRTSGGGAMRGPAEDADAGAAPDAAEPCIGAPPADDFGIRASLLLLSASDEDQAARDGLFTRYLLDVWNDGTFRGSYCDLYRRVRDRVLAETCGQEPQILMLGAPDPAFPLERAFRLAGGATPGRGAPVYR